MAALTISALHTLVTDDVAANEKRILVIPGTGEQFFSCKIDF